MSDAPCSPVSELETLPCWSVPVQAISRLTGLSGGSRLIQLCDGQRYVARRQDGLLQMQGVNREWERQVLCAIHQQVTRATDFLPQVLFHDAHWLVVSWLEGQPWSHSLADDEIAQRHLVALMRRFHPVDSELLLDIPSRLQFYRQQLSAEKQPEELFSLCAHFASLRSPSWWFPVLAHHDIHPGNILSQGTTLALIDWEYAARSPLACEFMLLFEANGFSAAQRQQFCRYYAEALYADSSNSSEADSVPAEPMACWLYRLQQDIACWQPWCEMLMAMWSAIRVEQTDEAQYAVWRDHYLRAAEHSLNKVIQRTE